jgi:hypothetical protein
MEEMIANYDGTRNNAFFSQLIYIKKKGLVVEHIDNFQRLNIKVMDILVLGTKYQYSIEKPQNKYSTP